LIQIFFTVPPGSELSTPKKSPGRPRNTYVPANSVCIWADKNRIPLLFFHLFKDEEVVPEMTTPPSKRLRKESSEYVTVHQEDVHIQGLGKPHIITLPSPAAKIAIQQSLLIFLKLQDPVCCQKILHRSLAEVSHSLKIILFLEIIIFTNTPG